MKFLSKAKLKFEYEDKHFVKWYSLKQNLLFDDDSNDVIIVPMGIFLTDLASVPNSLQWLFKPHGSYSRSAILHDYLYSQRNVSRFKADWIFLKAMKSDNVPFKTRWLFYTAVTLFGASSKY